MSLSYNQMYTTLVNTIKSKCVNIGTAYSSTLPSDIRTGSVCTTITIPRNNVTGVNAASNKETGTGTLKYNIPAVVAESTFTSNLQTFLTNNGISYSSTASLQAKFISHFINVVALFVSTQIYNYVSVAGTYAGNTYYFYVPTTVDMTLIPTTTNNIDLIDVDNCKTQLENAIQNYTSIKAMTDSSCLSMASSSSVFIAYFNIN